MGWYIYIHWTDDPTWIFYYEPYRYDPTPTQSGYTSIYIIPSGSQDSMRSFPSEWWSFSTHRPNSTLSSVESLHCYTFCYTRQHLRADWSLWVATVWLDWPLWSVIDRAEITSGSYILSTLGSSRHRLTAIRRICSRYAKIFIFLHPMLCLAILTYHFPSITDLH